MTDFDASLELLVQRFAAPETTDRASEFLVELAEALGWTTADARLRERSVPDITAQVFHATLADERALALFAHNHRHVNSVFLDAANYAYHANIEWCLLTNCREILIFNSHWTRNDSWYPLSDIRIGNLTAFVETLGAFRPEEVASFYPDSFFEKNQGPARRLVPVDDALVDRLDAWRTQALRFAQRVERLDDKLHTVFAQLFILRAVEDRHLATLTPLRDCLNADDSVDFGKLLSVFTAARSKIQSTLFDIEPPADIPPFVLGGIIRDLYRAHGLPNNARYNFAWVDADVLGRAYQKYLSTVLVPANSKNRQLDLFEQPLREIERVTQRKAAGVYYTPSFIVRPITRRCVREFFGTRTTGDPPRPPRIADISCGSGSFLTAAVNMVLDHLRSVDREKNWAREIVNSGCLVGIDIDPRAVALAQLALWLRFAEEPNPLPLPDLARTIICGDALAPQTWGALPSDFDIILGNPPFSSFSNIQSRDDLVSRFESAKGRFDYSYLFVEQSISKLAIGGLVGMVVPNRLFRNRDGQGIRRIIARDTQILELVDFGSESVFPEVDAYIGIIIVMRTPPGAEKHDVRYLGFKRAPGKYVAQSIAKLESLAAEVTTDTSLAYSTQHPGEDGPWLLLSRHAAVARIKLEDESKSLAEVAQVFQGIKTGANELFVLISESSASGRVLTLRNGLGTVHDLESQLLRPVAFGPAIRRYERLRPTSFLVYPYIEGTLIDEERLRKEFPHTWNYLEHYRYMLESRSSIAQSGLAWYELVRRRDENLLSSPKLAMRDLSMKTAFALDDLGDTFIVGGTVVVPEDEGLLLPLLGFLNSSAANWYLQQSTPAFRARFMKVEPQHLSKVPVPNALLEDDGIRSRMADLVSQMIRAMADNRPRDIKQLDDAINSEVYRAAKINPAEVGL